MEPIQSGFANQVLRVKVLNEIAAPEKVGGTSPINLLIPMIGLYCKVLLVSFLPS